MTTKATAKGRDHRLFLELAGIGFSVAFGDCALATLIHDPTRALIAIGAFTGATVGSTAALMLKRQRDGRRNRQAHRSSGGEVGVLTLCQDGHILALNSAAARIGNYAPGELVGEPLSRLYETREVEAGQPGNSLKAAAVGGTFEDEQVLVKRDGSRFIARVSATARASGFVFTITPVESAATRNAGDRRTGARIQTDETVRVRVLGGSTVERMGRLLDVSESGMGIELDQVITVSANVVIEWKCGFLVGTVRNCRRSRNGWEIGVELESVPARNAMTSSLKEAAQERVAGQPIP